MKLFLSTVVLFLSGYIGVNAHEDALYIHITDDGYEPSEITIKQGQAVVFENISSGAAWPAADIHPSHAGYPGSGIEKCGTDKESQIFDACATLEPGQEYAFTFEYAGEWQYHDHVFPTKIGAVKVTQVEGYAEPATELPKWVELSIRERLVVFWDRIVYGIFPKKLVAQTENLNFLDVSKDEERLSYWLRILGGKQYMDELLIDSDGGYTIDCHPEAHYVGRVSYMIYGAKVFADGDPSCHSGYYHGAMETLLAEKGTSNLSDTVTAVCDLFDTRFGNFECLHGVGHGVLAYQDYNMPKALDTCNELETYFEQSSCYGGAYMENVVTGQGNGAIEGHETQWLSQTDPLFPCNHESSMSDDTRLTECYKMQTSWMLTINGYDFDKLVQPCLSAPESMRSLCFLSFGRDAAGNSLREPNGMKALCSKVPDNYRADCIRGSVNVVIDFWGEKLSTQAAEYCQILDGTDKTQCYETLIMRMSDLSNDDTYKNAQCDLVEESHQYICE